MTSPGRPKTVYAGLAAAILLAIVCLMFALWNPAAAILPAIGFLAVFFGILKRSRWSAYSGALLILALATLFVYPQPMHAFVISGGSMENTLLAGDQVLVSPLLGAPGRGELVSLHYPVNRRVTLVKRVVAVGGDRVRIVNKRLMVNETPVNEPYVVHLSTSIDSFRDNFPSQPNVTLASSAWQEELAQNTVNDELVVPPGKFFVLGDNRDNSLDSRYWGFLERKDMIGVPVMIYFSREATPAQLTGGLFGAPPVLLHHSLIRWGRMFRIL
jgi:signal peptidase I